MHKPLMTALGLLALAGCGDPKVEVVFPLGIVNVSPHDGATGIETSVQPTVCFNRDVDPASLGDALALEEEGAGALPGQSPKATSSARCVAIDAGALEADTAYVIRIKATLEAQDGTALGTEITSGFRTAK